MLFGHRQDAIGYAEALNEFDAWLGEFIKKLGDEDILIITADHGCDPSDESTDHTREYVPYITFGKSVKSENLGTLDGFFNIGNAVLNYFGEKPIK
jgi:phosphopentomutase